MTAAVRWVLVLLVCAAPALAQDGKCQQCESVFPMSDATFWGTKMFCSKGCKDAFWSEYQDKQFRCKVCGEKAYDPSKPRPTGESPTAVKWDGLCAECRIAGRKVSSAAGGDIKASSHIEKFGPQGRPQRRRPLPRASFPEEDTGGVPTITWILFGVLGVLVGFRIYVASK